MNFTTPPGLGTLSRPIQAQHPGAQRKFQGETAPERCCFENGQERAKPCEGSEPGGIFPAREAWVNNRSLQETSYLCLCLISGPNPQLRRAERRRRRSEGAQTFHGRNPCRKQPGMLGGRWKTPGERRGQHRPSPGSCSSPSGSRLLLGGRSEVSESWPGHLGFSSNYCYFLGNSSWREVVQLGLGCRNPSGVIPGSSPCFRASNRVFPSLAGNEVTPKPLCAPRILTRAIPNPSPAGSTDQQPRK